MAGEQRSVSPRHVGLSIDPSREPGRGLVLSLGASRHEFLGPEDQSNRYLLDEWVTQLERLLSGGGTVMLPFNFSDECTGWLRVTSHDAFVAEVQAGWSGLGQYSFVAAEFAAVGAALTDFEPILNARIERRLQEIITAVEMCRDRFPGPA